MLALAAPDKASLYHHRPNGAESFELAITAHDCTYSALCHDPSHRSMTKPAAPKDGRLNLSFLLLASNPVHNSMDVTIAAEPERTSEMPAWRQRDTETTAWDVGTVDPRFLLLDLSDMLLDEPQNYCDTENNSWQFSGIFNAPTTSVDILSARVATLSNTLHDMAINKPHLKQGFDQSCQRGFFTASHFQNVLIFFFRRRHYHKDTIHWPTFDPDKVAVHSLLAVVLTGTVYLECLDQSPSSYLTTSLLELSEKYIYKELKSLVDQNTTPVTSRHMLEICQAAVLMNTLEGSSNHIEARRRIASKRIPTLVATLRKSGMIGLKHLPDESWETFIHRETCIRVAAWTFINDSLMALFCNNPPIMTAKEMTGYLPCANDIWEADSSVAFQERAEQKLIRSYPSSYNEAVAGILADEWTAVMRESFGKLDASDLFYVCASLLRHLFHCRTAAVSPDYPLMLLRALDRWDSLWPDAYERIPEDDRRWLGIAKHTPEVIAISRRAIKLIGTEEAKTSAYLQGIATYDTAVFHEFVQQFGQESQGGKAKN
ncbi:hypothetical protein F53441_2619 [Fusarium austroafricanum]|uniref:Xylanolytic transcriptional activator regulatory domain-containing protein n=1 Tax=Fusarium austroafricanum TaxID=2364996 RepID=A0A8H4KRG4_9HYPO|nr:hypothetical protein F53441_2619 [Fusarium austroafricanum]